MILVAVVLAVFGVATAKAQDADTLKEVGREFYLNFLPNVHDPKTWDYDTLQIFITTEKEAVVTVEAYRIGVSKPYVTKHTLPANSTKLLKYQSLEYELPGDYVNGYMIGSQTPVKCGFRITSSQEIHVYALTNSRMSSDAMIIYPIESLGKEYTVLSYTSDFLYTEQQTPGQFSIMATEDDTKIRIIPSSYTSRGDREPFNVVLNKNESYLVQGGIKKGAVLNIDSCDISGTQIIADKKIAVFGGHQRARVPYYTDAINPSRDFICEQLQAHETWGKNAIIAPCPQVETDNREIDDVFRIVSSADNNRIKIGDDIIHLDKGKVYEGNVGNGLAILADEPIMIAQYKRTSRMNSNGLGSRALGDPLMILIPPVEQFIKEATFLSFDLRGEGSIERGYKDHYAVIVTPLGTDINCTIDGKKINQNDFEIIKNSKFAYTIVKLKAGVHHFKSDKRCGVYCYGYGYANSYGYAGGMRPQYLDVYKPLMEAKEKECNNHKIFIDDNKYLSYGIKTIELLDNQSKNVQVDGVKINDADNSALVELSLIDKDRDGYYTLKAMDRGDNYSVYTDTINGSALSFINLDSDGKVNVKMNNSYNRSCAKILLQNRGFTVKVLNGINHTNIANYSFPQSQFPMSLAPGEIKEVLICSQYKDKEISSNNIDTLILSNDCEDVNAIVQVEYEPFTTQVISKCDVPLEIVVNSIPEEIFIESTNEISDEGKIHTTFGVEKDGITTIKLYDANGREVKYILNSELKAGIYKSTIDCSGISDGVYLINLINNGKSTASKIIINK